ncbi:MAG: hypothetical protein LiPW41_273 [Parcubacteria group bacterium LiPW_41]|nr:MAG: hypothetical protein LiPW41_273 [Parcubacteria group bacterium LiPW_41]
MNITQSMRLSSDLLEILIRSNLGLKVDGMFVEDSSIPKKIEITLSYFNSPSEAGVETSDRRKLELFGTNVRGYLDLCSRVSTLKEEMENSICPFPGFDPFQFSHINALELKEVLENFFQGNPLNNEVTINIRIEEIPFTRIYDITKTIMKLRAK